MSLRAFLNRFIPNESGVAAVEMALIAPAIAGLAFVSINLWDATMRRQNMDEALRVTSQYYLGGGMNDVDARQFGISAWPSRPADGQIVVTRSCRCATTTVTCTTLCTGNVPPATLITLVASATTPGATFQPTQLRQEMVRVR